MGKRKREVLDGQHPAQNEETTGALTDPQMAHSRVTAQIVTGSYERVLHGITATIEDSALDDATDPSAHPDAVQFADTFLFNAHASAIKSVALSPLPSPDAGPSTKMILASGGTDERVNLYHLSLSAPAADESMPSIPTLAGKKIAESSQNREIGSLLHHSAGITALHFPNRSKLLSAAEDNTISITRTRDWTVVSTIKAPQPKVQGRPSGDTAPYGGGPKGVNDFAVHPSMKLMVSVGKGERCMRLWNLVTGKKAGVLNFGKEILQDVGESKWASGEGRRIEWNATGDKYVVVFERGAIVFGMDSKPICKVLPKPRTKLQQVRFLSNTVSLAEDEEQLAASTEDGRIIFYSTTQYEHEDAASVSLVPTAMPTGQLHSKSTGEGNRVKDFELLSLPTAKASKQSMLIIAGCSNGNVQIWALSLKELTTLPPKRKNKTNGTNGGNVHEVGKLLGSYETGNRITCLAAFIMTEPEERDDDASVDGREASQDRESDEQSSSEDE